MNLEGEAITWESGRWIAKPFSRPYSGAIAVSCATQDVCTMVDDQGYVFEGSR